MIIKIGSGEAEKFMIVNTDRVSCVLTDGDLPDNIALDAAAKTVNLNHEFLRFP